MKNILIALGCLNLLGCATAAPYSYDERCASNGMVLRGINQSSTSGSGTAYNMNGGFATVNTTEYGVGISCTNPENDTEKLHVYQYYSASAPKSDYNSTIGLKRWITGLGYVAFVVPGVVMKFIYDSHYDDAMDKSAMKYKELKQQETESDKKVKPILQGVNE